MSIVCCNTSLSLIRDRGYLLGYANLTNTGSLPLLGDPDAGAYEPLFSFSSPEEKHEFLNLVRSNEDMGKDCGMKG